MRFIQRKTSQKHKFNQQYANNRWDGLHGLGELGRYSIIVGFARYFCKDANILDLGCGEGVLQEKFSPLDYQQYTGVDFSDVAIETANKTGHSNVNYIVGDLNNLVIDGTFDVIIYNESLYYLSNPKVAVTQLFANLKPGGIFIISLTDKKGKEYSELWNMLDSILDLQERNKVTNSQGNTWTVQVYKLKL